MMEAKKNETLLEIKDLKVSFPVHKKWLPAVDGVSLEIHPGEITCETMIQQYVMREKFCLKGRIFCKSRFPR